MSDTVKMLIAIILVICGVMSGLYVGIYVCLFGGIVQVINAVQSTPIDAVEAAFGIVRVLCTGLVGWLTAMVFFAPAVAICSR